MDMDIPPPGMEPGQLEKNLGWKEKCMDSSSLAMIDNYHFTRKNARFDLHSEMGLLWGDFQNPFLSADIMP